MFRIRFRSFIYCDDCGTGTYHAELCGGTAYKDRSADVNFPGSAWKDRVWQISCHGGVFSIAMIVVALTPLFLSIYGSVPLGESYVAVLGFGCMAAHVLRSVC